MFFFCEQLQTLNFDLHRHSWIVKRVWPKVFTCVNPHKLSYVIPVSLHHLDNSEFAITLRHRV